jgi:hypothetical protein
MPVKRLRAFLVNKLHTAFCEAFAYDESIIGIGDDINNGISNGEDVEAGIGHKGS